MVDLKLVKEAPCKVMINILEDILKKVKEGETKGLLVVTVDKMKHANARMRFIEPVTKLDMAGSLLVANHLVDKILMGDSKVDSFSNDNKRIRKGNKDEISKFLEAKVPCLIAKIVDSVKNSFLYLVIPKYLLKEMEEVIILADFDNENSCREYCRKHEIPCDFKIEEWI